MTDAAKIANDFPTANTPEGMAKWGELVKKTIGDKSIIDALYSKSDDGFFIDAAPKPTETPMPHQKREGGCIVSSFHNNGDVADVNKAILRDLSGGANALHLVLDIGGKRGSGIIVITEEDFATLLDGVHLNYIPISIDAGAEYVAATQVMVNVYRAKGLTSAQVNAQLNVDMVNVDDGITQLLNAVSQGMPNVTCVGVNGVSYHNSGSTAAEELAIMLSQGVAALRMMEKAGLSMAQATKQILFHMSVNQDVFMSMSKLRAFRFLWGEVLEASGLKGGKATIHTQTSKLMMANVDVETNILRTTAAAFSAMLGGADGISILPYDCHSDDKSNNQAARRIARNIAIILDEEGFLTRTHDVGAGSFSIEQLSKQLCEATWAKFTQIEAAGGINQASDMIKDWQQANMARRKQHVADGTKTIVGVNAFKLEKEGGV